MLKESTIILHLTHAEKSYEIITKFKTPTKELNNIILLVVRIQKKNNNSKLRNCLLSLYCEHSTYSRVP